MLFRQNRQGTFVRFRRCTVCATAALVLLACLVSVDIAYGADSAAASDATKSTGSEIPKGESSTTSTSTATTSPTADATKENGTSAADDHKSMSATDLLKQLGEKEKSGESSSVGGGAKTSTASATPAEKPPPKGQDAAIKLYSAKKFALAAKEFQKFINTGTANVDTHAYLAYCLYSMRQYHQALKQFDWVAKYATKEVSLQRSAESSASTLRCRMAGICPANCLKPNDPRWQRGPSGERIIKFPRAHGYDYVTDHDMGEIVIVQNGGIKLGGTCPVCGGTGTVPVLHDGDPVPQ